MDDRDGSAQQQQKTCSTHGAGSLQAAVVKRLSSAHCRLQPRPGRLYTAAAIGRERPPSRPGVCTVQARPSLGSAQTAV